MTRAGLCLLFLVGVVFSSIIPNEETNTEDWDTKPTNQFVVHLANGARASEIAARHGMKLVAQMKTRENYFVFERINPKENHLWPELALNHEIFRIEPQFTRKQFKRTVPSDPLYQSQWHLHGASLSDLNVVGVWDLGYTGTGVTISVVDDGLAYTHPDISPKYMAEISYDVNYQDSDPMPSTWDIHGTEAAGTAAAASNSVCGAGVAYDANIAGLRLLAADTADWQEAEAMNYGYDVVDIYSNSWGPYDDALRMEGPGPLTIEAFQNGVTNGRGGKGNIYVWAAGNGGASRDNCNYDGYANSRYTIAIGAIGKRGTITYYSEPCSAVVAVAPSSDSEGNYIYTNGAWGDCKTNFGGTSAACPQAAGVVALLLEANPDLGWRDVQGVLISSAQITDASNSEWFTNGGGYHTHPSYGFGRLDASRAISMAITWQNLPDCQNITSGVVNVNAPIPDHSSVTRSFSFTAASQLVVEHVEVDITITHSNRGQIQITLVSPFGTRSLLSDTHGDHTANIDWTYMSIRNWGESSVGTWQIIVADTTSGVSGTWNSYEIRIYGH